MAWLPDGEKILTIPLFVLAQLTNVTDARTDGYCMPAIAALSIARQKSPFSHTAAHIFVPPGDAPVIITQYVAWMEGQLDAFQTLVACTYLSSIVSELYDA